MHRIDWFCLNWLFFYWIKEYYIVESGFEIDDAIEIIDENRGRIYVKEYVAIDDENDESITTIDQEPEQGIIYYYYYIKNFLIIVHMKELFKEMAECKNEIRNLKSIVRLVLFPIQSNQFFSSRFYQKIVLSNVDQFQPVNTIPFICPINQFSFSRFSRFSRYRK
jgi:hypothetical protein